ncbi:MAG: Clp1/GlmU family protein [Candidatus Nezhaarchaeota archaeon]|nr:Clp1/GlmU family protein [Candidatus Nezhaarchaeota archaeon]
MLSRLHLFKNTYHEVGGPASIKLIRGLLSVLSKPIRPGELLTIPRSKTLPLEVIEDSIIEAKLGPESSIEELPSPPIPKEWSLVVEKVLRSSGQRRVMVLGSVDSGKTCFCTFLANKLVEKSIKVGILDCDPGQTEVFVPTTIALGLIEDYVAGLEKATLIDSVFIGSTSPVGLEERVVIGAKRLMEKATELGMDAVIVNTSGWILGRRARLLKQGLLTAIAPSHLALIQREAEVEHLIKPYTLGHEAEVLRLPIPPFIKSRSKEDRKIKRELAFKAYFSKAKIRKLTLDAVGLMYTLFTTGFRMTKERLTEVEKVVKQQVAYGEEGPDSLFIVLRKPPSTQVDELVAQLKEKLVKEEVLITHPGAERGLVVGLLNRSHRMLGLGLIEEIDYEERTVNILTPVEDAVSLIQVGQLKLNSECKEVARIDGWPL